MGHWREELVSMLADTDLIIFDPTNSKYEEEKADQIAWEVAALNWSMYPVFWFDESLAPLSLLELGVALNSTKKVFLGVDPKYPLREEIIARFYLINSRASSKIYHSVFDLAERLKLLSST